jgi:hypothetical protein
MDLIPPADFYAFDRTSIAAEHDHIHRPEHVPEELRGFILPLPNTELTPETGGLIMTGAAPVPVIGTRLTPAVGTCSLG